MLPTLPGFLQLTTRGVLLDLCKFTDSAEFSEFVTGLFSKDWYFTKLDYEIFSNLLYTPHRLHRASLVVRIAADLVAFSPYRKNLYKGVKFLANDTLAEYAFAPAMLETTIQHPIYGPAPVVEVDGIAQTQTLPPQIIGYEDRIHFEPTHLELGEFIAALWNKGVRFGLKIAQITQAIEENKSQRIAIAQALMPTKGVDARIQEEFDGMHRDNAPVSLDGKVDFRRFKSRYPQAKKGCVLLKKIPLQQGETGFTTTGAALTPATPKDIDLAALCGAGARVEFSPKGQVLLAAIEGFIQVDAVSGVVSLTETIEAKEAVSAKHTGDLDLSGEDFIARAEVQESRVVKGKNMQLKAAVYGTLISDAGHISAQGVLQGAHLIVSGAGSIEATQRATNTTIHAPQSSVVLDYAENCVVIGNRVRIKTAVNCAIVAQQLTIGEGKGCALAAHAVQAQLLLNSRHGATNLIVLTPDQEKPQQTKKLIRARVDSAQQKVSHNDTQIHAINTDPDFSRFLSIIQAVRAGKVALSAQTQEKLQGLHRIHTGALLSLQRLAKENAGLRELLAGSLDELAQHVAEQQAQYAQHMCTVAQLQGEAHAYSRVFAGALADCTQWTNSDVIGWIRSRRTEDVLVCSQENDHEKQVLDWQYAPKD